MIAGPRLIIADEPTTALDVTVQAEILALFRQLVADAGASLLFVTHDIALLPAVAERAVVMADGRAVEQGAVEELLTAPRHPATRSLIRAARATTFVENLAGAPA
ncbi:MAG: hypothetical protein LBD90_07725 [Bifidobacteriaceae bacterium]|nr:hypothetical protein [Bifidobacteriaceae bacterium]